MARRLGQDYKLYVDDGASNLNPIAGETSLSVARNTNLIDQSAKGDGAYAVQAVGKSEITISVSGGLQVPDANGLERIQSLATARTAGNFQVRVDPWSSSDTVFVASMYVSNFSLSLDDNANATFSFNLTLASAPTKDQLSP